jgi:putative DNA primase/helicase
MGEARRRSAGEIDKVLDKLKDVKPCGKGWSAQCPAHDDHHPSLTVTEADNGLILMHCHAECSYDDICRALGISNIVATYDYCNEASKLLYQVMRTTPKGFFMRRPNGEDGFKNGLGDLRRVLYRLPEFLKADRKQPVFIPEGEKDVDALHQLGLIATCNSGGAGKWRDEYNSWLSQREVVVLPDNDPQGEEHGQKVANSLLGVAASVKLVRLPNLTQKGDVSDWLSAGGTKEQLAALVEKAEILNSVSSTSTNRQHMESEFTLIPLDQLWDEADDEAAYVWESTLPVGGFSICSAKPKVGKSTFARNLAVAVTRGEEFLGRSTTTGKVIYLALEEKLSEVKGHFRRLGVDGKDILLHKGAIPKNAIDALARAIKQWQASLVIIDPLSRFVRVNDFNSYGEVSRVLEPVIDLARQSGAHILGLHHNGKAEREGADSLLGSTAFHGAVDTLIIMRRKDNNRYLYSDQRYGENLPETVARLDLPTGKLTPDGDLVTHQVHGLKPKIVETLGSETLNQSQIKERVVGNANLISRVLRELVDEGVIERMGHGVKNDPFLYATAIKKPILDFTPKANTESRNYEPRDDKDDWQDAVNF